MCFRPQSFTACKSLFPSSGWSGSLTLYLTQYSLWIDSPLWLSKAQVLDLSGLGDKELEGQSKFVLSCYGHFKAQIALCKSIQKLRYVSFNWMGPKASRYQQCCQIEVPMTTLGKMQLFKPFKCTIWQKGKISPQMAMRAHDTPSKLLNYAYLNFFRTSDLWQCRISICQKLEMQKHMALWALLILCPLV